MNKNYEIVVSSKTNKNFPDIYELWRYRELFYIFCWRDIKIRYKQTFLGVLWVVIQPIMVTGIFSVLFGKIAKMPSDGIIYPLFVMTGLLFWNLFSNGLTSASQSLIAYESMLKKVYFPRMIIPLSSILVHLVDFFIILFVLIIGFIIYGYHPTLFSIPILIISLACTLLACGGLGMFLAALNIRYRDVRYILPFVIQIGLYLTPVIYPLSALYDIRKNILMFNPLSGVIEVSRYALSGVGELNYVTLLLAIAISFVVFIAGSIYFYKTERSFADLA